jgi:hypothetical protein
LCPIANGPPMVIMPNIGAPSATPPAVAAPAGAGGPGTSRSGTFDGALSKYAAHDNSSAAAPVDHSAASNANQVPAVQKPPHPSASARNGTSNSTATAVPAQAPTPAQTPQTPTAGPANITGDASLKTNATSEAAVDAIASNEFSGIAAATVSSAGAQPARATLAGQTAAAVIAPAAPTTPGSAASPSADSPESAPANPLRYWDMAQPEPADAVVALPSAHQGLAAEFTSVLAAAPKESAAAQNGKIPGAEKTAANSASPSLPEPNIAVSTQPDSGITAQQPQQLQSDFRKIITTTEVVSEPSSIARARRID